MKRLLLLCIFVFFSPLSATIVNGYKYKIDNRIIYILEYNTIHNRYDDQRLEIVKKYITQWKHEGLIQNVVLGAISKYCLFRAKISNLLKQEHIPFTDLFDGHYLDNSYLFISFLDLLIKYEDTVKKYIENANPSKEEERIYKKIKQVSERFNLKGFNEELVKIDRKRDIFKVFENEDNITFTNKEGKIELLQGLELLLSIARDEPFMQKFFKKYINFCVNTAYPVFQKYSYNKNNQCMICFVEDAYTEDLLNRIENNLSGDFLFNGPNQNTNLNSFFKKTNNASLREQQLNDFFRVSPSLEIKIASGTASPLEERLVKGTATLYDKLKYKAWEWKGALIPVAAAGLGAATWWLNKNAKLNPSKPYRASKTDMTDIGDKHWWLNLPKKN